MRSLIYGLAFTVAGTTGASAEGLKPMQAQTLVLGAIQGVAYYRVEPEGLRLVITASSGQVGTIQRIISTLSTLLRSQIRHLPSRALRLRSNPQPRPRRHNRRQAGRPPRPIPVPRRD